MASTTIDPPASADGHAPPPPRRRRRLWLVLGIVAGVLVLVVVAGLLWFFFGRDQAREVGTDEAVESLRESGASAGAAAGLPAVGVYDAVASGSEDIGLPGLTESFGPGAPVTVTHDPAGCFTYRVDLNSHHARTWTFCAEGEAAAALTAAESFTTRDVPGLDLDSTTTYTCEVPIPFLWADPSIGETREGSCTGLSDTIDGTTFDAGVVEVLGIETLEVGGTQVEVVHVRSTDTFTEAQRGTEVDEWWLDADTGLPVRIVVDADLTSSVGDYVEKATVELTGLVPTT